MNLIVLDYVWELAFGSIPGQSVDKWALGLTSTLYSHGNWQRHPKGQFTHTMPFPCHAVPLRVWTVFPIWFTQCGCVWFAHAMPRPCHATIRLFWKRFLKTTAQRGMGMAWHGVFELASAVQRRHVGDLPAFGFFRLPRGVPRRLISEAYQSVKL
jgi:hypothetical protein